MITIFYVTGNGYRCGCCRQTENDYEDYGTLEEAIKGCISLAKSAEWDFSITETRGTADDRPDLESYEIGEILGKEVEYAAKHHLHLDKINDRKEKVKEIEKWFDSLDDEKQKKRERKEKLLKEISALEKEIPSRDETVSTC